MDSDAGLYRALLALEVDQTCGLMILSEELQVLVVNEAFREACPDFGAIEAWKALEIPDEMDSAHVFPPKHRSRGPSDSDTAV